MTDWSRFLNPMKRKPSPRDRYASYNDRVFSSVIDAVCIFFLLGPPLMALQDQFYDIQTLNAALKQDPPDGKTLGSLMVTMLLSTLLQLFCIGAALVFCEYKFHTTPGRWLLGLRLVSAKTETHPSLWQLIRRYLGYFISLPPLMFGYVWLNFDKRRQTWHDKIGGTVVLDDRPNGWYIAQVKRLWRKLRGKAEPEEPAPPANDN